MSSPGSPGIEIRLARVDELDEVGALARAAYEDAYMLSPEYLAEIADARGRSASAEIWVAADASSGALVGTLTAPRPGERLQDDTAAGEMDVRLLAVSVAARRRGVGEALMRHALELARERGARRLVLHTGSIMHAAQALYERMGFTVIPDRGHEFIALGERRRIIAYAYDIAR